MTCPDANVLAQLFDGDVAPDQRDALERHLDGCSHCAELVAEAALATPTRAVPARYRLLRQLGAGAMGVVWEAEDTTLDRHVALKFIRADAAMREEYRARMWREARALAKIRHEHVIAVYDHGSLGDLGNPDAEVFVALELAPGDTARAWQRAALRTPREIVELWLQVAAGLGAAHAAGIVHRDVKPDNIVVTREGRAVLADFGLATGAGTAGLESLTATGQLVGTPLYMALEVLRGGDASPNSDQFALAACIWEALAGALPFPAAATPVARAFAMMTPPARPAALDVAVHAVLARSLDPDPARRWPSVAAFAAALRATAASPARL